MSNKKSVDHTKIPDEQDENCHIHDTDISAILDCSGVDFEFDGKPLEYWSPAPENRVITPEVARMLQGQGREIGIHSTMAGVWFLCAKDDEKSDVFDEIEDMAEATPKLKQHLIDDKFYSFPCHDISWAFGLTAPNFDVREELLKGTIPESDMGLIIHRR